MGRGCLLWVMLLWLSGCVAMAPIPDRRTTEIEGHKMEYAVAGAGSPTIVFISGGGPAHMDSWSKIYPEAAKISRVVAYNRFGDGESDPAEEAQTGLRVTAALHALLRQTGQPPPYVLVGHSLGGLFANLFARQHPDEVAGVVLVDSSHPDQGEMMHHQGVVWNIVNGALLKIYSLINPTKFSELAAFDETAIQLKNAGAFPDVPLIVITGGKRVTFMVPAETIRTLEDHQRDLATLSPRGRQIVAGNSGHFVQLDEPEVVIDAIREVVAESRRSAP